MALYDLFGIDGYNNATPEELADQITIAQFLVRYRYRKHRAFQTRHRLTDVLRSTEWWDGIGCMLCFAASGTPEPDHTLSSCHRKAQLALVERTLQWLNTLEIAKDSCAGHGVCSFCWLFDPCRYVASGTGVCNRRPVIQQVIAVLSSLQNYRLGHVAAEFALQAGIDLSTEEGTRSWLQTRVPFKDPYVKDYWFPNLLLVYETLVVAFYYQQNIARGVDPLLGFPDHPAGQTKSPTEGNEGHLMKDWKESIDWARAIAWWDGKCGFCAGRNLKGSLIQHSLRQCTKGGKQAIRGDFGEAVYEDEILPLGGCGWCCLPFPICGAWTEDEAGKWVLPQSEIPACRYSTELLQNTMIGLLGSGNLTLQEAIYDVVGEYCVGKDIDLSFDGKTVACALSCIVTSEDNVIGSQMIRTLWYMTTGLCRRMGTLSVRTGA